MSNLRRRTTNIPRSLWTLATIGSLACGPALSEPSSHNISGRWSTNATIGPLSQILMDVAQQSDGTIQGHWSGKATPPDAPCPPGLGPAPTGAVNGSNTIFAVQLALLGAGDFQGQVIDNHTLRGSFRSCEAVYAVTFALVGPVPGG